jgi:DNA-binding HxlR family transcriptional regulator
MALLDLLGRRWMLRVLWELRHPAATFRELQRRCDDMSSSVLAERLSELRDAGVVASGRDGGYSLTPQGSALLDVLVPLNEWADSWARMRQSGA